MLVGKILGVCICKFHLGYLEEFSKVIIKHINYRYKVKFLLYKNIRAQKDDTVKSRSRESSYKNSHVVYFLFTFPSSDLISKTGFSPTIHTQKGCIVWIPVLIKISVFFHTFLWLFQTFFMKVCMHSFMCVSYP